DVNPFRTENYRTLSRVDSPDPYKDDLRRFLANFLPERFTWTPTERAAKSDLLGHGFLPKQLSGAVEGIARFIVAFTGVLFILIPMYIMALRTNPTKCLVTTTIAVFFFAVLCSVTFRSSNDQTLAATATYAAVLMVFVGFT
ncbi:hypothetical protein DM02DRAFT_490989, partial [Periconia macrospinosa]